MKNPKVTVLMPVYNAEAYLAEATAGVLGQSFSDFEFVIVNDGSKDKSAEMISALKDPRIVFIDNASNAGVVPRLNEGLRIAKGEYVARIDSDDVWIDKDKLSKQTAFLDANPGYGLIGTNAEIISQDGKKIYSLSYPLRDEELRKSILSKDYFVNCSVMFRRQLALDCGAYYQDEKYAEDYGLWLRIGRTTKFANLPETMSAYRINFSGITQSNQVAHARNSFTAVRRNRDSYPGYFRAWIKWNTKLFLLRVIGGQSLNKIIVRLKNQKIS